MKLMLHSEFPIELKEQWDKLLTESISHVPFLRFDYLHDWWSTRGGGEWPDDSRLAIITAYEDSRLIAIAPLFIAEHEEKKKLMMLGSIEISDFLDFICRQEDLDSFCLELLNFIHANVESELDISSLDLYNVLESSPTVKALETACESAGAQCEMKRLQHSPYIPLPGDWEKYLEQLDKKQRHELRRKMRRAADSEIPAILYITTEPGKLEEDMEDFLELMAQDEEKAIFLSPLMRTQMKLTMRCAFEKDCLQLAFLTVAGQKVAGYLSFDFLNRIWVYNSGLDRRYVSYSPGWVLLGHLLQRANENGRDEFDFMRGKEDYKYKFGSIDRFIMRMIITW